MANDGSIASLVEQWIVDQLNALPELAGSVAAFEGTFARDGEEFVNEMLSKRDGHAVVLFEGDEAIDLEEGEVAYLPTYAIYICVQNQRPASGRKGDGNKPGTNKLRDLVRVALHNKFPGISDDYYGTDDTQFGGCEIVFQRKDAFILKATVRVRETPTG